MARYMLGTCMPKDNINVKKKKNLVLRHGNFFIIRIHNGIMLACSAVESDHVVFW